MDRKKAEVKAIPAVELQKGYRVEVDGKYRYQLTSAEVVMFGTQAKVLAETTTGRLLSFGPYESAFVR